MLGVYIHIPFCDKICNYCDFCKIFTNKKYVDKYLKKLELEIKKRYNNELVTSIYIGGGTPSCLEICELEKLLKIVQRFNLDKNYEYTIECNIGDITEEKLKLFKQYGINRISIGVESFNNKIGKILGRECNKEKIIERVKLAKEYFSNINIDLIYAVSSDIEIVRDDIDSFLSLNIPHISCYSLILEEHTKLYINNFQSIKEDIDYEMYEYISKKLEDNNYRHYEISNYAKSGYESKHNINYWLNGEYYGFGLGAVSYLKHKRILNTKNMTKYLNGKYQYDICYENKKMQKENDLILGLRLIDGISISSFNKKYKDNLLDKDIIRELIADGYLEIVKDKIRCVKKYIYLQNIILEKIMGSEL